MLDLNDPRNQYLVAHPHFLSGVDYEQTRIIALLIRYIDYSGKFDAEAYKIIEHIRRGE